MVKIGRSTKVIVVGYKKRECEEFIDNVMSLFKWLKGHQPGLFKELHVGKTANRIVDSDGNTLQFYTAIAGSKTARASEAYRKLHSENVEERLDGLPYFGLNKRDFSDRVMIVDLMEKIDSSILESTLEHNRDEIMPYIIISHEDSEDACNMLIKGITYNSDYEPEIPGFDGAFSLVEVWISDQPMEEQFKGCDFYHAPMAVIEHLSLPVKEACQKLTSILFLSSLLIATEVETSETEE